MIEIDIPFQEHLGENPFRLSFHTHNFCCVILVLSYLEGTKIIRMIAYKLIFPALLKKA